MGGAICKQLNYFHQAEKPKWNEVEQNDLEKGQIEGQENGDES